MARYPKHKTQTWYLMQAAMLECNCTQRDIAKVLGIHEITLSRYSCGMAKTPDRVMDMLHKMTKGFWPSDVIPVRRRKVTCPRD